MSRPRKTNLADHTFGKNEASIILARILNNEDNPSLTRTVTRRLIGFTEVLNKLREMDDPKLVRHLTKLVREDFVRKTNESDYPDELKRFVNNVAIGRFRNLYHDKDFLSPS